MNVLRILVLTGAWIALWSELSIANAVIGLAVALGVVTLFRSPRTGTIVVRPLPALRFAVHFLYKLVQASVVVAITVVVPKRRLHAGIIAVPLEHCSDVLATLIADAISLTPGTLTLDVRRDPLTLYVHALDVRDVEHLRSDVRRLELLAVRAFGSRAAVQDSARDDTRVWSAE